MKPSLSRILPVPPVPAWEVVPVAEPEPLDALPVPAADPASRSRETLLDAGTIPGVQATNQKNVLADLGHTWDVVIESCLGVVCLPLGLAVLASLPLLNFMALGYLLEAGGRIARTGRFRDGLFGIRRAGRVGGLFGGILLTLLPVWAVSSMARSAELIDPASTVTRNWNLGLTAATTLAVVHIVLACLWGGKLRHFLLPILHPVYALLAFLHGNPITRARDGVWTCVTEAQPWYFFWLGLRGAVGALLWLAVPVTLLALGWKVPLFGLLGFLLLLPVLVVLPFLQINFAARNRFAAMFDALAVVQLYLQAPWACVFALFVTLLFALPLYLLKIELVPRDALFLPALVFIAFIWPARLLTGWVCGRAARRGRDSHWFFWITAALPVPLLVLVYAFFVWLSQYLSWYGVASLYEQHAFLLPVPFTGL